MAQTKFINAISSFTLLVALLFLLPVLMPATASAEVSMRRETLTLETAAGPKIINIEIADGPDQKARGLMFRTTLPDTSGMLFPYAQPQELTMWMRNTYIPLDMVFIRADGVVHRIEVRTEPLSERVIASNGNVTAVLELAGGAAERLGLKPGDRITHSHFSSKK